MATPTASDQTGERAPVIIDKHRRYDRGIRVWGAHGQEALEKAKICLLNAGPTGSEALKNLVLGGIHSFTIVDGQKVAHPDLGNNYLVTALALGESRARCVTDCLKELNETVAGSYVEEDPAELIANSPSFFSGFSLVIATQLQEGVATTLDVICRERNVDLLLARSYGLVGYLRNCVSEHCVIESKPDNEVIDLRLGNPWPQLEQAATTLDLDTLSEAEHSHVPFGLLLVKAAQSYKADHDGQLPSSSADRASFKELIRSWQRTIDGCPIPEENFAEALANAHRVWALATVPSEVSSILADAAAVDATFTTSTRTFWILVAALRRFVENEGQGTLLPLNDSLPDMHATTQQYLEVQRLYRNKAEADAAAVERYVHSILTTMNKDVSAISGAEIRNFCRHARHLRLVRSPPLKAVGEMRKGSSEALRSSLTSEDSAASATLAILLRAVDRFYEQHQRYPGTQSNGLEEDVTLLKSIAGSILLELGVGGAVVNDDLVYEMVRFGAGELHVVGSVVGAMVSQEAIKLVTGQFVPLGGDALIYDAMRCTTNVIPPM